MFCSSFHFKSFHTTFKFAAAHNFSRTFICNHKNFPQFFKFDATFPRCKFELIFFPMHFHKNFLSQRTHSILLSFCFPFVCGGDGVMFNIMLLHVLHCAAHNVRSVKLWRQQCVIFRFKCKFFLLLPHKRMPECTINFLSLLRDKLFR